MRRNLIKLENKIMAAHTKRGRAIAHYNLGLFHDNNGREVKAIPNYKKALNLGLRRNLRAQALAWLSSSLYKTGRYNLALTTLRQSKNLAKDRNHVKFLKGLEGRIVKKIK